MAARGSDLPGVTTARMLEQMTLGYEKALAGKGSGPRGRRPECVGGRHAQGGRAQLDEFGEGADRGPPHRQSRWASISWPLNAKERAEVERIFSAEDARRLVTSLKSRKDGARVKVLDAAYWVEEGCGSLGRLRIARSWSASVGIPGKTAVSA